MSPAEHDTNFGLPVPASHPLRKVVARILWPMLRHQVTFNHEVAGELARLVQRLDAIETRLARVDHDLAHHSDTFARIEGASARHEAAISRLETPSQTVIDAFAVHDEALRRHDEVLERFDLERTSFEQKVNDRVELVQRQAFARYHEGTGALRRELAEISRQLAEVSEELTRDVSEISLEARAHLERLDAAVRDELKDLRTTHGADLTRLRDAVSDRDAQIDRALAEQRIRLAALDAYLASLDGSPGEVRDTAGSGSPAATTEVLDALEDAVAAPRPLAKERYAAYVGRVRHAAQLGPVLDLTARNGDWIELLTETGIGAYGVTTSEHRANEGKRRGFDLRHEGVLSHLRGLAPGTLGAVCAFGLLESLDTDEILETLDLAARALRSGGVLLLECLDPANLVAATSLLHANPGARRPIPSASLAVLVGARGFVEVATAPSGEALGAIRTPTPERAPWAGDLTPIVTLLNEALLGPAYYTLHAIRP